MTQMLSDLVNVTLSVVPVGNLSQLADSGDANDTRGNITTTIFSLSTAAPVMPILIPASVNRSSTVTTSTSGSTNRSVTSSQPLMTTMLIQTEATAVITSRRTNSHVTRVTSTPTAASTTTPGDTGNQRHHHPSNVSTSSQHQQHAAAASYASPSSSTTRTTTGSSGGLPVALLWLPYAALTLFLTALLVASFVHFHCKNGHKYKRRRSPSSLTISSSTPGNGSGGHWRDHIVDHINEQSSIIVADPTTTTSIIGGVEVSDGVSAVNRTLSGRDKSEMTTRLGVNCELRSGRQKGRSNRRQSVEFVSNRNGSMVNMRGVGTPGAETGRRVTSSVAGDRQAQYPHHSHHHHHHHPRLEQHQNPSQDTSTDKSTQPLVAAFRHCIDSNPLNIATGSGKTTIRSLKARIAPSRGRLGARAAITAIDEARSATDGGVCPSSSSSLYSAVRICQMDDTAEDWNRLLASGQSRL